MEVIYEPSIVDRLRKLRYEARRDRRTARKVVLTKSETDELCDAFPIFTPVVPSLRRSIIFMGVLVE